MHFLCIFQSSTLLDVVKVGVFFTMASVNWRICVSDARNLTPKLKMPVVCRRRNLIGLSSTDARIRVALARRHCGRFFDTEIEMSFIFT